jgi:hypothetical protein
MTDISSSVADLFGCFTRVQSIAQILNMQYNIIINEGPKTDSSFAAFRGQLPSVLVDRCVFARLYN